MTSTKTSRWITAAQHAQLVALMSGGAGMSPPYIRGPKNILMLYKNPDDKNVYDYHIEPSVAGDWSISYPGTDYVELVGSTRETSIKVRAIKGSSYVDDVILSYKDSSGAVIATKKLTVVRPAKVIRTKKVYPHGTGWVAPYYGFTGEMEFTVYDQLLTPRTFPPPGYPHVFIDEIISADNASAHVHGPTYTGGRDIRPNGTVKDVWEFSSTQQFDNWIYAKQQLTIGDWITDIWQTKETIDDTGGGDFNFYGKNETLFNPKP